MKKKDAEKFAQRVSDVIEEELVACGFDREIICEYLKLTNSKHFISSICGDVKELTNFKKNLSKINL